MVDIDPKLQIQAKLQGHISRSKHVICKNLKFPFEKKRFIRFVISGQFCIPRTGQEPQKIL